MKSGIGCVVDSSDLRVPIRNTR